MDRPNPPYIEFKGVSVRYNDDVTALTGIHLSISKGEFVFLLGSTGAGKSTLLRLLTRDARETSGTVVFNGQDLARLPERQIPLLRRQMGIVPQDYALLPRKRVWENVAYAMRAVGNTRREVRRKWPGIIEQVRMGHRVDAFPHQLSGGEQQRVAIARALINSPSLLLADEPTGNLDPQISWEIMELLLQLNREGTTVVVASHDLLVVDRLREVARVVTLEQGRISSDASPSIFGQPQLDLDAGSEHAQPGVAEKPVEPTETSSEPAPDEPDTEVRHV